MSTLSLSPERTRTLGIGAAGLVGTVALWWLVAATVLARFQVPTPGEVLSTFADRGFDYYRTVFSITLEESLYGYLVGVALALTVAVLVLLVPFIEPIVMQLAVITYCLPIVVLAPILITVHEIPEKGGLSATAIDLAAVSVFFTTVVGAVLGFRAADQATLDVVEVYGGSRLQQLLRVRVVAALPALFTTLQIAVAHPQPEQPGDRARVVARHRLRARVGPGVRPARAARSRRGAVVAGSGLMRVLAVARPLLTILVVLAATIGAWYALVTLTGVSDLTTRLPQDVIAYLFTEDDAAANRAEVLGALGQTVIDAGIGFVAGLSAAFVLATVMVLWSGVEAATMPVVMIVRTVPLVALAPIITLLFGNGFWCVAVMSGIVVLFPALVNIAYGLRSVTPQMHDVVTVYGGSSWDVMRRVAFPTALPSIFAAIRISVPAAITGALIAEYFTTTDSVGKAVNQALALYQYDKLWSLVVVVTLVSVIGYALAQLAETFVLARYGRNAGRA